MTFQYCSDLHLEFTENRRWMNQHPLKPVGEVLLLAGDILLFNALSRHGDFLDFIGDNYDAVYWIPGNHEYYCYDLNKKPSPFIENVRSNIFIVNEQVIRHKEINLIFSTLWSHISPTNELAIQNSMNDFAVIKYKDKKLMPYKYNELHEASKEFLENAFIETAGQPLIVVTHHVPTFSNYPEKYINSPINQGFAVNLDNLIDSSGADYWIYGHHHCNIPEFKIGRTTLLTNQLGYVRYDENYAFNDSAIITI